MSELQEALEREHHEIDRGIEAFLADPTSTEPLTAAMEALRRHIFLEEEFLFPPLRAKGLEMPTLVMLREHGELWRTMDALTVQVEADSAGSAVRELCDELLQRLASHNSKEEPLFYPQADTGLTPADAANVRAYLGTGALPDGWTCAGAGTVGLPIR